MTNRDIRLPTRSLDVRVFTWRVSTRSGNGADRAALLTTVKTDAPI